MTTMTTSPATATKTTRRPTLAHLKRFVAKHRDSGLMILVQSRFDGMVDGVEPTGQTEFCEVTFNGRGDIESSTLGINGVWLVGQSRDSISEYNKDGMVGYHVYNCCGSFNLAVREADVNKPAPIATPAPSTDSPVVGFTICERATKGGKPFWCAAPSVRVSREEWDANLAKCKSAGGWWHGAFGGFAAGWSFWREADARAFVASIS